MSGESLLKLDSFEPREYQKSIAETASQKNTLVVLPTGVGKTLIAILVGTRRLEQYPGSKILITAPSRPLNAQHKKSFEKFTTIPPEEIILVTGKIRPEDREQLYHKGKVIVATPQTIENDLKNNKLNLENISFVTFDEAHRCIKDYAYTYVAKRYMLQAKHPLILGLTASPGGTPQRIKEICDNLFIKAVEIRTEIDSDVEKYVKPITRDFIYVDLPDEFEKIKILLEEVLKDDLHWLREHHYTFTYRPTKKMLLDLQKKIISRYMAGPKSYGVFWAMIRIIGAIKIEHAIELLETQGISFLYDYLKRLEKSKKKTDKRILKDPRIREAIKLVEELYTKTIDHPKLEKLVSVVKDLLKDDPNARMIIFANYRATVEKINDLLRKEGIKSEILIGQAVKEGSGMSQEQQIEILRRFADTEFNALIGTQISEEGLSIADVPYVIFYEPVASEIRMIQRRGRTGRTSPGKVIFLITKGTRDEAYYWAAFKKEAKMKRILYNMRGKNIERKKITLLDWVK
jgi:Fanconi anemia group M protein